MTTSPTRHFVASAPTRHFATTPRTLDPSRRKVVTSEVLVPASVRPSIVDWREKRIRVITPNQEAARSLGVVALSLEDISKRVLRNAGHVVASPLDARRIFREAVRRRAGVIDADGFAAAAEATLRELIRGGLDPTILEDDDAPRVRRLGAVVREARVVARERDVVLDVDALWLAAEACRSAPSVGERAVVVGYPRLPVAERKFLDAYAVDGSMVILPCTDDPLFADHRAAVDHFAEMGWSVSHFDEPSTTVGARLASVWLGANSLGGDLPLGSGDLPHGSDEESGDPAASAPAAAARTYPDRDAEVRGVLGEVKRLLLQGVQADAIAVVARHERTYGPLLRAVADEYGVPFRALYTLPLAETRLGAWLVAGLEAMTDGWPFEATVRWLADPVADGISTARIRNVRETHPHGRDAWSEHGVELPEAWPEAGTRGGYLERLTELLEAFGVPERVARWPREALAWQRLEEELAGLNDRDEPQRFEGFAAELAEILGVLSVPLDPGRGGVELHTPLSLFGAQVDHVFVVGVAEGQLPNPVRADPFLDPAERERLRAHLPWLEDVRAQSRREEISFWAVLQSVQRRIVLSFPTTTARSETLPSPYLSRLGLTGAPAERTDVHSPAEFRRAALRADVGERADDVLDQARHAHRVEARRESDADPDRFDGLTGVPYAPPGGSVSASRLIDHASCPFRFWSASVLRIDEVREAPTSLDPLLQGSLYHDALEHAVEAARGAADLRAATLAALDDALAAAEERLEAERGVRVAALPGWDRERGDLLDRLRRAVQGPAFIAEGARVAALEQSFRGRWRGLEVHGRIDRIDAEDERAVLIDYKSGGSISRKVKDAAGKASLDLQLPIYRAGSERLRRDLLPGLDADACELRYYSISKADTISSKEPSDDEQDRIAAEVRASWSTGAFPVLPDHQFKVCSTCPYDPVCRKGPRLERKRRSP